MLFPNGFCHFYPYHYLSHSHLNISWVAGMGKVFFIFPKRKKEEILLAKSKYLSLSLERRKRFYVLQFLLCIFKSINIPSFGPQRIYKASGVLASLHQFDFTQKTSIFTQLSVFTCLHAYIVALDSKQPSAPNAQSWRGTFLLLFLTLHEKFRCLKDDSYSNRCAELMCMHIFVANKSVSAASKMKNLRRFLTKTKI